MSGVASRNVVAGAGTSAYSQESRAGRIAVLFVAVLCAVMVGGCAQRSAMDDARLSARIAQEAPLVASKAVPARRVRTASRPASPRTARRLLRPQPAPDCTFRGPVSSPITAEETRMKLDYEQQCYRQAEAIARARLEKLQASVDKKKKANR